ncbi:MAG: sulfopyruvate decarboxylase subunit alpha [Anaerolineae bacterium]
MKEDWGEAILRSLKGNGMRLVTTVPDLVIGRLLTAMADDPFFETVTLTREEEGIGILSGAYLGGRRGTLMMQVSGLGNCINGLASLALPYQIPFLMLISQRGELGEFNPCQINMGRSARPILEALGIQHFTLRWPHEIETIVEGAIKTAYSGQTPVAVFLSAELVGWKEEE